MIRQAVFSFFLVNWRLYAQVVQVCVTLFNTMSLLVQSLLEARGEQDPLPAFDYPRLEDSEYVLCSSVSAVLKDSLTLKVDF
jgi:hypothetical protein